MRCPFCKAIEDKVIDSRAGNDQAVIRRRRECVDCGRRFTTYERIEEMPLRVVKKDGSRVPFERQKVLSGLLLACHKRPVSTETLEEVTNRIEARVSQLFGSEVPSRIIGDYVMSELRELDQVAYVRFASVYKEFKDVGEFMTELRQMLSGETGDASGAKA